MKEKSIKKQIQQFWKKELTSPNLIYLLGGVEQGVEEYTIFFSADDLTLYPDNWEEFLIRLEAAFNSIARIRGKKHDAQSLLKEIKARCEVYLSTRDHEELKPEIAKLEESYLSLKVKADFKDIFSKISKNSKSEPFMYPVDKNNYPQYYEIVAQPMDLTSWKKSINNFKNIKEGCDTLRLIWQNCLLFNVEGSEISETARILATETENMIQQKFGEEFADFKYLKRKTEKSDIQREEKKIKKDFDPAFVKNVLSLLLDHELALPFMKPVREVDAPGYFDCVKTPMDLSLIKNRVKINYYNSLDVFIREVDLIWENCLLYNDPKSEIASHAKTLRSYFHNLVKTPKLSIKETNSKEPKSSSPSKSMAEILRSLKEYNPYCSPFILPVDEKLAPGYSEIISRPICLMQIEENLKSRVYVDISKFVEDVRLVWLNCLQYNLPESQISQWAQKCQERFEELLGESPEFSPYRTVSKARDLPIMSIPDEVGEDPDGEDSDSKDRKNRPKINFRERKFRTILHQLVTDKIVGDLFSQNGVSSSSEEGTFNFTSIREEAKRFIDTPLEFYSFVRSKLLNLRRPPKSKTDIDLTMLAVSKLSDLFQRSFPNLPLPDGTDERSEKNQLTSFISSSCKIDRFHLIKKILQLLPGGQNVENTVTDMTCSFVNETAHRHAQDLLKQTKLPYIVTPNVYEIQQFGEICLLPRFHDANLLYPIGYSNRTVLHLTLFENRDQRSYDVPFVVVNAVSHVLIDKTTSTPIFSISLDNSVEISRSLISPLDAWNAVVGKEQQILDALGSKLKRCRAVFNRLCISPDAVPFLEPIPTDDSVGLDYYRVITSPMWLREVYERLIDGTYDNEFDFAWDIRLMLRNCWNYNAPNSSVHSAALRLGEVFETLLADWIYNIQDRAVNDLAKGEWDDWMYLKYFDAADPSSNFCCISGKKAKPSDFLSCRWCEDQYLPSTLGLTLKSRSTTWSCPRCTVALEFCEGDLRNAPKFSFQDSLYAASNFDKNVFVPATEVGLGWFQARRKGRGGLKNVFLSPLGYEVFSREEIKLQNDFEEVIDKELMAARTKEYQERNLENRRDRGKRQRRSKVQAKETVLDPALLDLFHPRHLEDGRILTGKIANFCLPTNLSWQIRVNSEGSEGNASWVPLNEVKLSGTAYFGLNVPEVVSRIEGLPNASRCENYTFKTAENMKSQIQSDLEQHQLKVQNLTSAAENVADLLLKQRWEWKAANDSKIHELNDISSFFSLENNLSEFKPLLFESVAQESMDIIFVIWDFINSTADVTGIGNVSLSELATSFTPPQSILSTIGQCIYDDICSGLTDHLLSDMALGRDLPRTEWQEFLITHPVNSITWPKIAEFVLLSFSLPLNVDQMRLLLNTTLFGESLLQLKAFTLFSNHPEIVSILEVPGVRILYDELLEKVLLNSTDAQLLESSREQFQDLIDQFLIKVKSADGGEDARTTISVFSQWCSQLMERLGSSSTEDPPVSNVDRLALPAAWGSYSMRFYGFQSHDFNLYLNFVPEYSSPYQARLKFLSWLEKTLFLLGSNDPESWTTRDRILVAVTLVDYCRCTAKCLKGLLEWQASSSQSLENLSDNDLLFECDSNKLIVPKDAKCIFTGISFDQLPDANQWAVVSSDLYSSFKVPVLELNSDSKHSTRYSGFALRPILQSMIRCRDNSRKDQAKYEVVMTKAFEDLTVGKFETCDFTTNYLGTQCIGIDSFGNSIWLLRSQEKSTLFSIDSNGRSFNPEKLSVTEPCFLGRSKQGIWFYHHADAISTLLKQFSVLSPEMTLRLTERYLSTKSKFTDSLSIQPTQKIWLDRKLYLEKWASTASLYTGASDAHRCRQIEMQYARCGEARMNVYYSDFYSKDCSIRDPSAKRIADYQTLGSLDFNPIKGWQNDGLKRIACNTVATRIHSDPTIALWVVQNLARNKLLKKVKSLSEIVPSDEALEKSKEAPDESSQKVIPNLEANPTIGLTLTDYINNRLREAQTIPTKTKAILQIHPADDSILRVYNSGKEAAQSLSVSQSGISLCLNGLKSESYGFKWKWYEGPPIDFDSIQNLQLPLSEVRSLQIMRGKPIGQAQEVIERPLESKAVPTLNTDAPKTADSSFSFPPVTIVRNQPHIVTSTKTTSSKLIKLKSEIFCILYSFPEKALKWPELDAASENLIQSAGDSAYNNVLSVSASVQAVARENGHIVDINKMAEKASRKARRRLRRKLAVEIFTKAVQSAASPSELLNQVIVLETAIPATLTYVYNRGGLPVTASTAAEVGWRLFSLDRSIAYDEINGIEHAAVSCAVKLRVCYSPRCLLSGNCTRYLSHSGKCALGAASFSRLPDQYQIAPPNEGFGLQSSSVTHSSTQEIHRKVTVPPPAVKSHPRVVEEYLPRLASYLSKEGVDIENINPWIPPSSEIANSQWI